MTTTVRHYLSRVKLAFQGWQGQVALDQLCAVDKSRLVEPLGFAGLATRQLGNLCCSRGRKSSRDGLVLKTRQRINQRISQRIKRPNWLTCHPNQFP